MLKLYKNMLKSNITKKTIEQIKILFDKFGYNVTFKRGDIEIILKIKKTRSLDIINLLRNNDLIEIENTSTYKFKK